jgi:hypothetical protein
MKISDFIVIRRAAGRPGWFRIQRGGYCSNHKHIFYWGQWALEIGRKGVCK